jgi:hypothetical protein
MSRINSFTLRLKYDNLLYIVLAIIDFVIALDYTRGGVIYTTDPRAHLARLARNAKSIGVNG